MKKTALTICLLFALVFSSCSAKAESQSTSQPPPVAGDLKQQYMQNMSFQIPADWDSESAVQGSYYTAPDGGIFYVNVANHAPFDMAEEGYAKYALDKTSEYLQRSMNGFSAVKQEDLIFLDRYARKTWFTIELMPEDQDDEDFVPGSITLFSLMFADRKHVYNLIFTISSPDVEAAMPGIIQSVTIAQKE